MKISRFGLVSFALLMVSNSCRPKVQTEKLQVSEESDESQSNEGPEDQKVIKVRKGDKGNCSFSDLTACQMYLVESLNDTNWTDLNDATFNMVHFGGPGKMYWYNSGYDTEKRELDWEVRDGKFYLEFLGKVYRGWCKGPYVYGRREDTSGNTEAEWVLIPMDEVYYDAEGKQRWNKRE